jgi:integrase
VPKVSTTRITKKVIDDAAPGAFVWDSEVKGFGLRVTPAGTKSFVYRYRADGKQRYEAIGPFPGLTADEAREKAETLRGKHRTDHRAVREQAEAERRRAKTLEDLAEHYLGPYAAARALRPGTLRDARGVLRLVDDDMKAKRVADVTKPDVRRMHSEARNTAGVYQANRLLAVLSKMFSLAEEEGWRTGDNPVRGVKKYNEDQRWRNLSETEVARLLDACDAYVGLDPNKGRNAADAVRLLLYTGARLQEALKADWSQFDLERGRWEKPSAHTKTKRQHRLELVGPALDLLRDMRERDPKGQFLFPGEPLILPNGAEVERPRADLKRPWSWISREAGLMGVRLHDLRRTTASFMLSGGASLATIGRQLGHTQASTTARYAHLADDVQGVAMRQAGERMVALKGTVPKGQIVVFKMEK